MRKDSIFWACISTSMIALLLLVMLKPQVHLLPVLAMTIIIKVELILQLVLGFYGTWVSIDPKLFSIFTKIYIGLVVIYVILKVPALSFLYNYYIDARQLFSPFPFVLVWIMHKAFYQFSGEKETNEFNL